MIFLTNFTVESGVEGAIGEVVVDEQLLVGGVVVGAEAGDIGVARAADGSSLSLERAASAPAAGAVAVAVVGLAEAADGDGGAAAGDDPVHDAAAALPDDVRGGPEQLLQLHPEPVVHRDEHLPLLPSAAAPVLAAGERDRPALVLGGLLLLVPGRRGAPPPALPLQHDAGHDGHHDNGGEDGHRR